jgi:hypothetical protein
MTKFTGKIANLTITGNGRPSAAFVVRSALNDKEKAFIVSAASSPEVGAVPAMLNVLSVAHVMQATLTVGFTKEAAGVAEATQLSFDLLTISGKRKTAPKPAGRKRRTAAPDQNLLAHTGAVSTFKITAAGARSLELVTNLTIDRAGNTAPFVLSGIPERGLWFAGRAVTVANGYFFGTPVSIVYSFDTYGSRRIGDISAPPPIREFA